MLSKNTKYFSYHTESRQNTLSLCRFVSWSARYKCNKCMAKKQRLSKWFVL